MSRSSSPTEQKQTCTMDDIIAAYNQGKFPANLDQFQYALYARLKQTEYQIPIVNDDDMQIIHDSGFTWSFTIEKMTKDFSNNNQISLPNLPNNFETIITNLEKKAELAELSEIEPSDDDCSAHSTDEKTQALLNPPAGGDDKPHLPRHKHHIKKFNTLVCRLAVLDTIRRIKETQDHQPTLCLGQNLSSPWISSGHVFAEALLKPLVGIVLLLSSSYLWLSGDITPNNKDESHDYPRAFLTVGIIGVLLALLLRRVTYNYARRARCNIMIDRLEWDGAAIIDYLKEKYNCVIEILNNIIKIHQPSENGLADSSFLETYNKTRQQFAPNEIFNEPKQTVVIANPADPHDQTLRRRYEWQARAVIITETIDALALTITLMPGLLFALGHQKGNENFTADKRLGFYIYALLIGAFGGAIKAVAGVNNYFLQHSELDAAITWYARGERLPKLEHLSASYAYLRKLVPYLPLPITLLFSLLHVAGTLTTGAFDHGIARAFKVCYLVPIAIGAAVKTRKYDVNNILAAFTTNSEERQDLMDQWKNRPWLRYVRQFITHEWFSARFLDTSTSRLRHATFAITCYGPGLFLIAAEAIRKFIQNVINPGDDYLEPSIAELGDLSSRTAPAAIIIGLLVAFIQTQQCYKATLRDAQRKAEETNIQIEVIDEAKTASDHSESSRNICLQIPAYVQQLLSDCRWRLCPRPADRQPLLNDSTALTEATGKAGGYGTNLPNNPPGV